MLKKIQLLFACYLFKYSDDVDNIWKEHILYTAYQLEDFQKEAYNYEKNQLQKDFYKSLWIFNSFAQMWFREQLGRTAAHQIQVRE